MRFMAYCICSTCICICFFLYMSLHINSLYFVPF